MCDLVFFTSHQIHSRLSKKKILQLLCIFEFGFPNYLSNGPNSYGICPLSWSQESVSQWRFWLFLLRVLLVSPSTERRTSLTLTKN